MENIEDMRKRHEKEIKTLQELCSHLEVTDWKEYYWAIGHFGGFVKVCKKCGKVMKKKGIEIND